MYILDFRENNTKLLLKKILEKNNLKKNTKLILRVSYYKINC